LRSGTLDVNNFCAIPTTAALDWKKRGATGLRHFERRDVMPFSSDAGMDAADARLQLDSSRDGDTLTIKLAGELDLGSVQDLETAILAAEKSDADLIVVDLADVTFIDSTGLSQLLEAKRRNDKRFKVNPSSHDAVTRLLSITDTTEILQ
jgi:anti-anti-sigma factor